MARFEVGFYYKANVHVEAEDAAEAFEKAVAMHLEVTAQSDDDPSAETQFVEFMDPDITEIKEG